MKIFVTGSSGFIGKELVNNLSGKHEIIGYDLADGNNILDYDNLVKKMQGSDVVVHLAALRKPYDNKTFDDYFKVNCEGTFNVAEAALENRVKRLIYSSSTSYYGIEQGIPFPTPVNESNPVVTQYAKVEDLKCRDCDVAYSTSKVISEQILANYGLRKKFQVIILRIGPTRGRGEVRPFLGINLKMENALQALELAIAAEQELWYEAFTITDELKNVDLSKAKKLLGYRPK